MAGIQRAVAGHVPAGWLDAVAEEVRDLVALGRRLAPHGRLRLTRRHAGILALAMLALVALSGVAGAAEPDPGTRSALEAWTATPLPGTAAAPADVPGGVAPVASTAPAGLPAGALGADAAFGGPNPVDLVTKGLLVIVLLFITLRVLRRLQGAGGTRRTGILNVLETRPLGPKTQLHLIAVGDRRFMIGQSPSGLVALGELDAAELPSMDVEAGDVRLPEPSPVPAEFPAPAEFQAPRSPSARAPLPLPAQAPLLARLAGPAGPSRPRPGARFERALAMADRATCAAQAVRPATPSRLARTTDREPAARIMERILEAAAEAPAGRAEERLAARMSVAALPAGSRPVARGRLEVSA